MWSGRELRCAGRTALACFIEANSILPDTKIFISPFGLGEFSGKDYEAILAGCVLVSEAVR